ncbi:MAG: 1-deoxy-D-xylulose-5-phosphate synthase, partial [Dehalococcoidaceae bacterium]|nr:1-deoxy-D-xylulose-5-phosphate synthase [Dehalococcoidaceae bacterium]
RVVIITAAMPEGNSLTRIQQELPGRVIDVGICEQHAVTFAAGLATQGYRPVVAIYSTFLQRALDQLIHDICLQNLPVVFAIDRAGIVGEDGKTHQGTFDLSYLSLIPNMIVSAPKDENELQHMLFTAIDTASPFAVRYPRGCGYGTVMDEHFKLLEVGRAEQLRQGKDLVIVSTGTTVMPSLGAARELSERNIDAGVINCRFIKPLDEALLEHVARTTRNMLVVEENVLSGGLGSRIALALHNSHVSDTNLKCIGINDVFTEHGPQEILRSANLLDSRGILSQALLMMGQAPGLDTRDLKADLSQGL